MKAFSILYKLNGNKRNKNDEILFFSLYANKLYFYIGSTNGRIYIFKKKETCLFGYLHFVNLIKSRTSEVITKIFVVDKFKLLIHGTSNGDIFLIKGNKLITGKEVEGKSLKKNIYMLKNKYHKSSISSINILISEKNQLIYLFIGDLDGILSCFILNEKLKIENDEDCILLIDKMNGSINNIEISRNNILVTCEKYNTIISLEDVILKREKKINSFKNIGKKENKNYYKSVFLKAKKKKINTNTILSLRQNGRIWLSKDEKVINTLVFYYPSYYFFYLFFFNIPRYNNTSHNTTSDQTENVFFSFDFYKKYFINNKYFITIIHEILEKFTNFNLLLKPNANVCYKFTNSHFILFEQTNPFSYFLNKHKNTHTASGLSYYEEKKKMDEESLAKDINNIRKFINDKLQDELKKNELKNERNNNIIECLSFILNNLNDTKEILNRIKTKKIFIINIKTIHIEEIMNLNAGVLCVKGRNKIDEVNNTTSLSSIDDKNSKHSQTKENPNTYTTSLNCAYKMGNTIENIKKYKDYLLHDTIIDSIKIENKLYMLYYSESINNDIYFNFNMKESMHVYPNYYQSDVYKEEVNNNRSRNGLNFYLCEIYFEQDYELIKYIIYHIKKKKINQLNKSNLLIFYLFINIFQNCIKDERKETGSKYYDSSFFNFIEKDINSYDNIVTVSTFESAKNSLANNIERIKINTEKIFNQSKNSKNDKSNILLTDKSCIYQKDLFFFCNNTYNISGNIFLFFHFNIKKIKKLYKILKVVIERYKYIFQNIIANVVFPNIDKTYFKKNNNNFLLINQEDIKNGDLFIKFIQNDQYLLFQILYYFYIFIYLEIIISNYTHRNNNAFTNFPILSNQHPNKSPSNEYVQNGKKSSNLNNSTSKHCNLYIVQVEKSNNVPIKSKQNNLHVIGKCVKYRSSYKIRNRSDTNLEKNICLYNYPEICEEKYLFFKIKNRITTKSMELYRNINSMLVLQFFKMKEDKKKKLIMIYNNIKFLNRKKKYIIKKNSLLKLVKQKAGKYAIYLTTTMSKANNLESKKNKNNTNIPGHKVNEIKGVTNLNALPFIPRPTSLRSNKCNIKHFDNILKTIFLIKNIKKERNNITNLEYIKKCLTIQDLFKFTNKLYLYKKILQGVYIININEYKQLYEYLFLFEIFSPFFYNNMWIYSFCENLNINNQKCKEEMDRNNYKQNDVPNQEQNYYKRSIKFIANTDIQYYQKLNDLIQSNNIFLIDILLGIYNSITTEQYVNPKFVFKKFCNFNYLCDYINYIKINKNNSILDNSEKKKYLRLWSYDPDKFEKENEMQAHIYFCKKSKTKSNTLEKTNNFTPSNVNLLKQKIKKVKKMQVNMYATHFDDTLNEYINLRNSIFLKKKKNEYSRLIYFKNLDLFNFIKIAYFLCKAKLEKHLYLKKKKIWREIPRKYYKFFQNKYDNTEKIDICKNDFKSLCCNNKLCYCLCCFSIWRKTKTTSSWCNVFNLYGKYSRVCKRRVLYKHYKSKDSNSYTKIKKKKKKDSIRYGHNEWNEKMCVELLEYISKRDKKSLKKKKINILYKLFYILVELKWKKTMLLFLNIFKKYKSKELLFLLLLLIKSPFKNKIKQDENSWRKKEIYKSCNYTKLFKKSIYHFYNNYTTILRNKTNFENNAMIFFLLFKLVKNGANYYYVIMLIIYHFFLDKIFFLENVILQKYKMPKEYFLLYLFLFKNNPFFKKFLFFKSFFLSFHTKGYFLFADYVVIKNILTSCYKLLPFDNSNYLIVLNNSLYLHFFKIYKYFFDQNSFNFSYYHFAFFMLISYFYLGYFTHIKKFLIDFCGIFSSLRRALQSGNRGEETLTRTTGEANKVNRTTTCQPIHSYKNDIHLLTRNSSNLLHKDIPIVFKNKIDNNTSFFTIKKFTPQGIEGDTTHCQTKPINVDNRILQKNDHLNLLDKQNEGFEKDILNSIDVLIQFFYELLLKLLCEINFKIYDNQIELLIFRHNKNLDIYIQINNFINNFYGSSTLYYDKNQDCSEKTDKEINNGNTGNIINLNFYDKKNNIHIFLEIINLFFNIYYCLFSIKLSLKKKKKIINKNKFYSKYLLTIISILFMLATKTEEGDKKQNKMEKKQTQIVFPFFKDMHFNKNYNNKEECYTFSKGLKKKIINNLQIKKKGPSLAALFCVLCIIQYINYFKDMKKKIKQKIIFIINFFGANQNLAYLKQDCKENVSSKNIHEIYKTIIKNIPQNIK
ncbi:conserved Plasmodium protein, unknown function [Plasmodium vinckei vinckei]|uniref:Uncharacterized protein n=1 Tax=Plasmodium vinckei vinckei TaxID=54757 RepID=A0A449BV05_PLAVN|nr:conserved Plasmodium protein, unknown function [Plasmodium vinckei vinckei]KEG02687.1 hypothetical protein YYE_02519 [Plasmodium vinckei vinckei]VEV57316.1 conserved Plasmodium protein, unknown function [Plasmodium vinckei vinckei]